MTSACPAPTSSEGTTTTTSCDRLTRPPSLARPPSPVLAPLLAWRTLTRPALRRCHARAASASASVGSSRSLASRRAFASACFASHSARIRSPSRRFIAERALSSPRSRYHRRLITCTQ